MKKIALVSIPLALVILLIWWWRASPRAVPLPPPGPPKAFEMGPLVFHKTGDPAAERPPEAPVLTIVEPAKPIVIGTQDDLPCKVRVVVRPGAPMPSFLIVHFTYLANNAAHQLGAEPIRRDPDGSYLFGMVFKAPFKPGRYTVHAESQIIYRTGPYFESGDVIDKPYYFESPRIDVSVR